MVRPANKPTIGLTGGIGSGKSSVAKLLADLGCCVSNSDELARQAFNDPTIRQQLVDWWGDVILDADGRIIRGAIARIVFSDQKQRQRLEELTHPWIEKERMKSFAAASDDTVAFVIDAPLLLEAGLDRVCDAIIFVDADRDIRLARLAESRGWDAAELARRELSQMPLDAKRSAADYVIGNNGNLDELARAVRDALERILRTTHE